MFTLSFTLNLGILLPGVSNYSLVLSLYFIWQFEGTCVCVSKHSLFITHYVSTLASYVQVIANDSDVQRCHLLIHQTKHMCSPNIMVTNHDAQLFPGLKDKSGYDGTTTSDNSVPVPADSNDDGNGLLFDRILCDVPCSGDGTLRKAPDIWRKWYFAFINSTSPLCLVWHSLASLNSPK